MTFELIGICVNVVTPKRVMQHVVRELNILEKIKTKIIKTQHSSSIQIRGYGLNKWCTTSFN